MSAEQDKPLVPPLPEFPVTDPPIPIQPPVPGNLPPEIPSGVLAIDYKDVVALIITNIHEANQLHEFYMTADEFILKLPKFKVHINKIVYFINYLEQQGINRDPNFDSIKEQ